MLNRVATLLRNLELDNLGKKKNLEKPGIWEVLNKNLEFLIILTCIVVKF